MTRYNGGHPIRKEVPLKFNGTQKVRHIPTGLIGYTADWSIGSFSRLVRYRVVVNNKDIDDHGAGNWYPEEDLEICNG